MRKNRVLKKNKQKESKFLIFLLKSKLKFKNNKTYK